MSRTDEPDIAKIAKLYARAINDQEQMSGDLLELDRLLTYVDACLGLVEDPERILADAGLVLGKAREMVARALLRMGVISEVGELRRDERPDDWDGMVCR